MLYDDGIDLDDDSLLLWRAFNNIDPARDLVVTQNGLILDATRKGPEDIATTDEIKKLVDAKSAEFGLPQALS